MFVTASGVVTDPQTALASEADDVERHPCPRCSASPGSPCRPRSAGQPERLPTHDQG
ncbi:zinc finger domain-containing protein [Streptomyces olivoreticuli]|uniref:zinc finger domain-containing protein n=1 Tax=Streptomyces olivoreticuli TaxID=68246 RepID=UPI003CC7D6D5